MTIRNMCEKFHTNWIKIVAATLLTDKQRDKQTDTHTNGTDQHTWRFFQIRQVTIQVKCGVS